MLILCSATLLTLFISSKRFLVETSGFLYVVSCILKTDNIISSFLIQMHFISVSCLITLAGTSNTMLNESRESQHPCLILMLEERFHLFPIEYHVSIRLVFYDLQQISNGYKWYHNLNFGFHVFIGHFGNKINFVILILYFVIFMKSGILSRSVFIEFL